VPLAVLGVLPILWNSVRSFWIRHYLASLIPALARKHASLTVDPAAGVVVVVLDKLELRAVNIFSRGCQQKSLAPGIVRHIDPQLVGCSWMGFYEAGILPTKGMGSQRVIIDASLRFESVGLYCDSETFLFLALGLGVDPYCNQLHRIAEGTMHDMSNTPVLDVTIIRHSATVQLRSGLSFSERRALAWFCTMIVQTDSGILYIPLSKATENGDFTQQPRLHSIKPELKKLDNDGVDLNLALHWTFYAESIFYNEGNGELLPVPQKVLQAREAALAQLQTLSTDNLEIHLQKIFNHDTSIVNKVLAMLKITWLEIVPNIRDGKRTGQPQQSLKSCQTYLNLRSLCPTSDIIQRLYGGIQLGKSQPQNQALLFSDTSDPIFTASRIWLGLSVIQLWRREAWDTKLGFHDGRVVAKPTFDLLYELLDEDKTRSYEDIIIG